MFTLSSDSEHCSHHPSTCKAHVKQVKQRPILAWELCHLCKEGTKDELLPGEVN